MSVYKVPQDVEADDKLIGPFSFRQFIYLIIVALSGALAWFLWQIFIPLAIIPVPVILLFGSLALPLRKDQPMEVYIAAIVSFYLKPRRRLWQPDGIQSMVEVTAPKIIEVQRTKEISDIEAEKRLSYLANVVDSGGWSVRGVPMPPVQDSSISSDVFFESQQAEDMLDDNNRVAQSFDSIIDQSDAQHHKQIIDSMSSVVPIVPIPDPYAGLSQTPLNQSEPITTDVSQTSSSEIAISPDIINLARNSDLSIQTIAHEANRIREKQERQNDEVVISLR